MQNPMRLELTLAALLVELANHYATLGVLLITDIELTESSSQFN